MSVEAQKVESSSQPTPTQSQQPKLVENKVLTVDPNGDEDETKEDDHFCPSCNSPIIVSSTEPFECGKCQAQFDPTLYIRCSTTLKADGTTASTISCSAPSTSYLPSASSIPISSSSSTSLASSAFSLSSSYSSPSYSSLLMEAKKEAQQVSGSGASSSMSAASSSPLSDSNTTDDQLTFDHTRSSSSSLSSNSSQLPLAPGVFVRIERKEEKAARKDAKRMASTSTITSPYQMLINPMLGGSAAASINNSARKHDYGIIMDIRQGFVKVNVVTEVQNKQGSVRYNSKWIPVEHVSEVDPREFTNKTKH